MSAFLPLDSHPMVFFITCEMHGFPINFPHSMGKCNEMHRIGHRIGRA